MTDEVLTARVPAGYLQFEGGPANGTRVGWTGPWPPPESITHAQGFHTGMSTFVDWDALPDHTRRDLERTAKVTHYRRASWSSLTDEQVQATDHVVRGARYLAEEEGTP